jgi:hypothetical protein
LFATSSNIGDLVSVIFFEPQTAPSLPPRA